MIKRISVKDLKLGMFVQELHSSWINHPFWKSKFLLEDPDDLKKLQTSGVNEISIDLDRSVVAPEPKPETVQPVVVSSAKAPPQKSKHVSLHEELSRARDLCNRSREAVISMFREARMGKTISATSVNTVVDQIVMSVERHPQALISLARLKTSDDYSYMHSVAVSAMMVALATEMGHDKQQIQEAGAAGLLHDLGKVAVPDAILNKPGALSEEEFVVIKTHPVKGAEILSGVEGVRPNVVDACLHHHEKMNGTGYPHGTQGEEISLLARMTAICDVYDAITSNRPYKNGWCPAESLQRMMQWKGHFDPAIFQVFVKTVGIYPNGSLVRLGSQRLAVVVDQSSRNILNPKVKIFFSLRSSLPLTPLVVDLSSPSVEDKIEAREPRENWNFPYLDELWQSED